MRNLYFVQVNDIYQGVRKSAYIPYAAGCIEAYCLKNPVIAKEFRFGKIVYCRDDIDKIIAGFDNPCAVFFSCSVWNTQFNLKLARAIKQVYPACRIAFGGHQVTSSTKYLETYDFIDFVTHRAGEEPTEGILECLALGLPFDRVPNLSFRAESGEIITTRDEQQTGIDYPSPYLEGIFDDIMKDDIDFSCLFETNRGCPNSCSYCDWGTLKSKVRLFPMEKVFAEIDWFVSHKIEYIYCADANFCLFSRDEKIVDYIIECSEKYGYPKFFHVNFTKNRLDFVFDVSTRMVRHNLSKAQTIAFQSMNPEVLKNIGRKNMSTEHFRELMRRFSEQNIATYSELILGLPGETYESFCDGICSLLENGQHFAINVYPCEILPNAEMGQAWYREKYKIESTFVPFRLMHATFDAQTDESPEYAEYSTSTYSMTKQEWAKSMLFASCIQGFHNLGLLRAVAIYLRYVKNMPYIEFYNRIIDFAFKNPGTHTGALIARVYSLCEGVANGRNAFTELCGGTDNILWGFDEILFIEASRDREKIYAEIKKIFESDCAGEEYDALFDYQQSIMKKPGQTDIVIRSDYDFYSFFAGVYKNSPAPLERKAIELKIHDGGAVSTFADFARQTVWYGRNRRESDYTSGFYKVETAD